MRKEKGEGRAAESKINQVSGQTIRNALDGRAGVFRLFNDLNDTAEGGIAPPFPPRSPARPND